MSADVRRVLVAQGLRAFGYGFGAVLLGASLEQRGWSSREVGFVLTAIVAGMAVMTIAVGAFGDRIGRRRTYGALFLLLAASGAAFGLLDSLWLLGAVALLGAMSTDVVESGPFTSIEQSMLASAVEGSSRTRVFGVYNAVASLVGSLGALAVGGPSILRHVWPGAPSDQRFLLLFVAIGLAGALVASSLSARVDAPRPASASTARFKLPPSNVLRLSALFAVDSFGGGFIIQSFLAFWFARRFDLSAEALGLMFFAMGLLQAVSFIAATRIADRIGLLNTMVFTHLPSNILLIAIPLAPNLQIAIALLLARFALSQMDVPTRQAYIAALVDPEERTAAAAYTNSARYVVRPAGPLLAGTAQQVAVGLPFFIGGGIKAAYDVALWLWFRRVRLADSEEQDREARPGDAAATNE